MYQNIYYDRRLNKMHIWDDKFGHQTFRYKKYALGGYGLAEAMQNLSSLYRLWLELFREDLEYLMA